MSATEIPRSTTERQQLIRVIDASDALVNATSDPRVPQEVRDHALRAQHAAWGALGDFDRRGGEVDMQVITLSLADVDDILDALHFATDHHQSVRVAIEDGFKLSVGGDAWSLPYGVDTTGTSR